MTKIEKRQPMVFFTIVLLIVLFALIGSACGVLDPDPERDTLNPDPDPTLEHIEVQLVGRHGGANLYRVMDPHTGTICYTYSYGISCVQMEIDCD